MSEYRKIANFGKGAANAPSNNPLTYCLADNVDVRMNHGSSADVLVPSSRNCQLFMSEYCSHKWDDACEFASHRQGNSYDYPNQLLPEWALQVNHGMTEGEILVRNTAAKKYLVAMGGNYCQMKREPFDPTVASSPMVTYWEGNCVPVYQVDPKTINSDKVMDKLLAKPWIGIDILVNIYNNMKNKGTLHELVGTKLGHYYRHDPLFQKYLHSKSMN